MVCQAWMYKESEECKRTLHQYSPNQEVTCDQLAELGVLQWTIDPDTELEKVDEIMKQRKYASRDQVFLTNQIEISKEKLPNYEEKLESFFKE